MRDSASFSRRDVLRGTGALALAGVLAACGSNTGRAGAGTISQWYHQYGEKGTQQAAERFAKAYTKADVKIQWTPGDYSQKLSSGLLSSSGPDVFENQLNVDLVRAKQIVPLDDIFAAAKSDFIGPAIDANTFDGKLYAVPMIEDMQLLFYRKSLLAKANVQPPKTIAELIEAAKKLNSNKVKGIFLGNFSGTNGNSVLSALSVWPSGADFLTPDHKVGFHQPGVAQTLQQLRQLFTSGSLLLGAPTDWSDPSAFIQGLTAMQWSGIWAIPQIKAAFGDDFGVAAWPALNASGKQSVPIGTWGAMVSAKSKNVDAAKQFVKWLWIDQVDDQLEWATKYGFHIPVRTSILAKAAALKSGIGADVATFSKDFAKNSTPPDWTPKMQSAYADVVTQVVQNGAEAEPALAKAEQLVDTELKRLFG
jgi:multiple sugar transport system substrate-binding protein